MKNIETLAAEILKAYDENRRFRCFGIWGSNEMYEIEDDAPKSFNTADDAEWGERLDGTCTIGLNWQGGDIDELIEELTEKVAYHVANYPHDHRYIVAGCDYEYGQDDSEWIIKGAEIIAVIG